MKKLFLLLLLFVGTLSFSQTKPKEKDIDKESNVLLDSLSKVYKVKVQSIMEEYYNGVTTTSISYVKDKKLVYRIIAVKKD